MIYLKRAVRGSALVFVNLLVAAFVGYLIRIILARNLSASEFGLFYAMLTFILFFETFRSLGTNIALVKYIPEFKIKKKLNHIKSAITSCLSIQLITSIIFVIIVLFISNFLAKNYFKSEISSQLLKILVFYFILAALVNVLKETLRGFQNTVFAYIDTVLNIGVLLFVTLFILLGYGIYAPVFSYLFAAIIVFVIFLFPAIKTFNIFRYKIVDFSPVAKKLLYFGIPLLLGGVGRQIIGYFDVLMLTYFSSLEQVGIYNVALPFALALALLSGAVSTILLPMVSELWAKKEKKKLKDGLNLIYKYAFLIILPIAFGAFVFAAPLIEALFSSQYVAGADAFRILIIGVALVVVAQMNLNFLSGLGKPKIVTKIIALSALVNIIFNLFLIPLFGIEGAAFATAISYLMMLIMSLFKINKIIKTRIPFGAWIKTLVIGLIFTGVIVLIQNLININIWIKIIISVLIGILIYAVLAVFLKLIDIKELKEYARIIK